MLLWWNRVRRSDFFIRLKNWEYWPFGIVQLPLFFYYPWLSLRARSFTFFSASNPGIVMGGMFGESKYDVLSKLPTEIIPKTVLITQPTTLDIILRRMDENDLRFPLIFKPDIGERGYLVRRINSIAEVERYLSEMKFAFLMQEFVDLPFEFGVFYRRFPLQQNGTVTSVVMKEMLSVTGDGRATLQELILQNDRAKLQWASLREKYSRELENVVPTGKKIELVSIGNHCLGTKFINGNHLINDSLNRAFDVISRRIEGFYFGRFDLRAASIEDLRNGKVVVLELNGCGAEPAHIYDPQFSFLKAVSTLIVHWKTIFEIARQNRTLGHSFLSLREAWNHYQSFKEKTR